MDVVGDDREYEWSLDGQRWLQDAHGRFSLTHVAGKALEGDQPDLDFLVGAQQAPDGQSWLPASFRHCPQTGAPLEPVRYALQQRWLPPYGNGSGRRVVEGSCKLDAAEQTIAAVYQRLDRASPRNLNAARKFDQLPRSNGLNFLVANLGGHREALFALARDGSLFRWQRKAEEWVGVLPHSTPIGRCSLQSWAWGVSLREQGSQQCLLLACDEGATEVRVDPLAGRYHLERCPGRAIAAPGELEEQVLIPQQMPDGSFCVVARQNDQWLAHPIALANPQHLHNLSAPLRDPASRRLLWIGAHGYLSVKLGESLEAQWLSWPPGAQARPEYGPPFVNGYGIWQQLFEGSEQYCLRLDSDERKEVKGSRLSTGQLNYMFNVRLDAPWGEHDVDNNPADREVVYPFIEFSDNPHLLSCRVRWPSSLQQFFGNEQPVETEYCLERIGQPALSLLLKVAQPWNAQWFCYDNALWLYIDSTGALYRWNA
ncbi:hypothetical protein ACIOVF_26990 [Pseudomonas sp. NPDC087612]|uniref:hypothetical protein n=1 Tax=Pseudomonas sp. NPDC087612 TaxID=3364441 RepID=UPI00381C3841